MQSRWYHRQPEKQRKAVVERRRKNREANRRKLSEYLAARGCQTCREKDPMVLEFHHPNPDKEYQIGDMVASGYSWLAILKELAKCEVQCANDHRRIEAKKRGSYHRLLSA